LPKTLRWLWILIVAGVCLRLLAIHLRGVDAIYHAPDEGEYFALAKNLAHGEGYVLEGVPTAYRDVLFPAVASFVFRAAGDNPLLVYYLQILIDVLTALMLRRIARRRFGETVGVFAAGIWLLYPAAILFSAMFLTETLFVFLWVAVIVEHDRLEDAGYNTRKAISLGIGLGLLLLTRAAGMALLLTILIYLLLIRYETPFRVRARAAGIVLAACVVVILPWMIRNAVVMDRFSLTTNMGINLYIGNNPYATGAYRYDDPVTEPLFSHGLNETQRDTRARELAASYFYDDTRDAVNLWSKKFAHFWSTDMSYWAHYAPNTTGMSLSEYLRSFPIWRLALIAIPYMLIVAFGIAGYFLTARFPTRGLFILQIFLGTMMILMSYGLARYHFPFIPALIIGGLSLIRSRPWKSAPQWRRVFYLTTIGMFGGIWLYEVLTIAGR
jgi:4-amino-4-deoxy-L-arabinose transferase-like glycosyltransferase